MPSKEATSTPLAQVEASIQEPSTPLALDSNLSQVQTIPRVEGSTFSYMIYAPSWEVYEDSSLEEVSRPLVEPLALPKSRRERAGKSLSSTCIADADAMFKHIAQTLEAKLKKAKEAKETNFRAMCAASMYNQENLQEIAKLKKENQELQASDKNEINDIQASHKSEMKKFRMLHKE
ncbi:hypothetical protein ACH5RR_009379 [Cinchona calisaya]|uniref:Uncharacterized protein n=1 Tax=Cinchona calisaya TaxID=153742 RepID=A0ABD3AHG1_9GENT